MAEGDYNVKAIISAETSRFENGMKNAQKSLDGVSKSIGNVSNLLKTAFSVAGVSIGVNTFVNALKSIDTEASESSKQLKLLSNTVKITGAATWTSAKQMNELAESISKNTNYSVNDIRKMETVLLGFKNITGETFTEASNAITDMTTVMGMDLTSAVQTVGKALDDPIKGLDSLRRQGFAFTDEQKKELEQLVKNGKQMEAQKIILDELATTYGGAAKQAADSGKQLENNIKNLKAELGKSWDGSIEPIKKAANVLIERWTEAIKKMNEANAAAKNLKTVLSSAGETGDVSDAKSVQAGLNSQMFADYTELSKLVDLRSMKLKDMSKVQKETMYELTSYYDMYIQRFRADGVSELEAVKLAREAKKAEWTQGLNDFQMIVEKEKQLEKEREEVEKAAADEEAIARRKALTDAYDETVAKAKEEIKIRKSMGEKISEEAEQTKLLEVMKSAYLKMIEDSNGEMKEEAVRLQAIIDLQKKLEKTTNDSFKVINADWNDFEQAVINVYSEIEEEASSWTDFFEDSFKIFGKFGQQAIEGIGEALVNGSSAWENMGATALEMIAQILEALAAELAALVAVNYATWNFDKSATAAAGAAAALVAAGTLKGVASNMKKVSNAAKEANGNLEEFRKLLKNLQETTISSGIPGLKENIKSYSDTLKKTKEDLEKYSSYLINELNNFFSRGFIKYNFKTVDEIKNYLLNSEAYKAIKETMGSSSADKLYASYFGEYDKLLTKYKEAIASYESAINSLISGQEETTQSLKDSITSITETLLGNWGDLSETFNKYTKSVIQNDILEVFKNAYEDVLKIGSNLATNLIDGFTKGLSKKEFMASLKDYIKQIVVSTALYTEEFTQKIQNVTLSLSKAIVAGNKKEISSAVNSIETLYTTAEGMISNLTSAMDTLFAKYEDDVEDISGSFDSIGFDFESQLKAIKESLQSSLLDFQNIGVNVGNTLANAIITGMKEEDLSGELKSYLKETFYKTQVYSKYSTELAKLGENISKIISSGTTSGLAAVKKQVESIYSTIKKESTAFANALDDIFGTVSESITNTMSDTMSDVGNNISNELINGFTSGLTQKDFMGKIKDYLRKMVIETVVYTQSMKAEIEAIGKAISEGITKGFSETGLHEIRRDLSYVFEQANKAIDKVDTMFDTVFSGYATGTQNATAGLHLVGEAGPELVRFRGGEQVLNAGNTQKVLGDTGRTNNFNVTFNNLQDTSAFAMVQQFKDYQRQLAIDGVF